MFFRTRVQKNTKAVWRVSEVWLHVNCHPSGDTDCFLRPNSCCQSSAHNCTNKHMCTHLKTHMYIYCKYKQIHIHTNSSGDTDCFLTPHYSCQSSAHKYTNKHKHINIRKHLQIIQMYKIHRPTLKHR